MQMTTTKFILLRVYLSTFGRFAWPAQILKRLMVLLLVRRSPDPHVPSAWFFTPDQLRENDE